jgi:hypothetical protein
MQPTDLMRYLERVRGAVGIPVSTCDPWHVWHQVSRAGAARGLHLRAPAAYWEGQDSDVALKVALDNYEMNPEGLPAQAHRDRRNRLALERRPHPVRQGHEGERGLVPAPVSSRSRASAASTTT